ncbi:hypothetical protein [Kocuria sp.]|uniref:hypothetical protein n=1 Tax=Kocuria sp. TaxID=1871328 RepID=UPI0026E009AC|nr:hypothetical protein [Kocuria sp.]MDO5617777.1 hypothetical protein [Kocuria sp.]
MTTDQQAAGISRRTIAKGAAWAVPAIAVATAAPAYAASPGHCFTQNWSQYSGSASGATYVLRSSSGQTLNMTVTATQTSGVASSRNMTIGYQGIGGSGASDTISGMNASNTGLVLNHFYPNASMRVMFTFDSPIVSASFPIYDITYDRNTISNNQYQHQDAVTFSSGTATLSGNTTNMSATSGPAGTRFNRSAELRTNGASPGATNVSLTNITGSSLTITYANLYTGSTGTWATRNAEYIGIGNMTICT